MSVLSNATPETDPHLFTSSGRPTLHAPKGWTHHLQSGDGVLSVTHTRGHMSVTRLTVDRVLSKTLELSNGRKIHKHDGVSMREGDLSPAPRIWNGVPTFWPTTSWNLAVIAERAAEKAAAAKLRRDQRDLADQVANCDDRTTLNLIAKLLKVEL